MTGQRMVNCLDRLAVDGRIKAIHLAKAASKRGKIIPDWSRPNQQCRRDVDHRPSSGPICRPSMLPTCRVVLVGRPDRSKNSRLYRLSYTFCRRKPGRRFLSHSRDPGEAPAISGGRTGSGVLPGRSEGVVLTIPRWADSFRTRNRR
jgi:hypothetical protein